MQSFEKFTHYKPFKIYYDKRKDVIYSDDCIAFDVETTSAWVKDGVIYEYKKAYPNEWYKDAEPISLVYLWSFAYENNVYYGRRVEDFIYILDKLKKDVHYTIYVHNLGYEFEVALLNILTPSKVFARQPHHPIYVEFEEYPNIQFRCSFLLTRLSLRDWAEQSGTYKDAPILYTRIRTPNTHLTWTILNYAEQDVKAMIVGLRKFRKQYKHVHNIPLTQTGKVRRVIRNMLEKNSDWINMCIECLPRDYEELEFFTNCFYGGYVHASYEWAMMVVEWVYSNDFASSYPYVMCAEKYPVTPFVVDDYTADPEKVYLLRVKAKNMDCKLINTFLSTSKCQFIKGEVLDNGRILKCDEAVFCVTNIDFEIIKEVYDGEFEILNCYSAYVDYLPKEFIEFILMLYSEKTRLKNIPKMEEIYLKHKEELNALFGMMVAALIPEQIVYSKKDGWKVEKPTSTLINSELKKKRSSFKERPFLNFTHGIFITSYAKRNLWKCLIPNDRYVAYSDTDSLKMAKDIDFSWYNKEVDDKLKIMCFIRGINYNLTKPYDKYGECHPLGYFEREWVAEEFVTLGAKRYCYRKKGKLHLTCAGINKGAVDVLNDDINNFSDELVFSHKNNKCRKMLLTHINGDMLEVTWRQGKYDEYNSTHKYGINMRKIDYSLNINDLYKDLVNEFRITGGF